VNDYGLTQGTKLPPLGFRCFLKTVDGGEARGEVLAVRPHERRLWTEVDVAMTSGALNGIKGFRTFYLPAFEGALV
jgi:hypothetical protein